MSKMNHTNKIVKKLLLQFGFTCFFFFFIEKVFIDFFFDCKLNSEKIFFQ